MKLKCIGCEALARPTYLAAAYSPHIVDLEINKLGLHNQPADLRLYLQSKIDAASGLGYDAIVMAYGLCGKSTAGLTARDVPLVIPRAHDCITLFLGSRARYQEEFEKCSGTYWYALDYLQRNDRPGTVLSLGSEMAADIQSLYDEYVQKYGKDNADYLMEVMGGWQKHYERAVYVDMGVGDGDAVEHTAQNDANRRGWRFERMEGNMILIRRLLEGDWANDFLVVHPGQQIQMTYDEEVIRSVKVGTPEG
jgi:hypothetical protein